MHSEITSCIAVENSPGYNPTDLFNVTPCQPSSLLTSCQTLPASIYMFDYGVLHCPGCLLILINLLLVKVGEICNLCKH